MEDNNAISFVSIASLWEIAIKVNLDKLELTTPFKEINKQIHNNGFKLLPITFEDTLYISALPFYHRDPFDRIIIAQAATNALTIISKDDRFSAYNTKCLW